MTEASQFDSRQGQEILLLSEVTRPVRVPIYLSLWGRWLPGARRTGVKRSGHEADNLPPFSTKVENEWRYTLGLLHLHGIHGSTFTFNLLLDP